MNNYNKFIENQRENTNCHDCKKENTQCKMFSNTILNNGKFVRNEVKYLCNNCYYELIKD